MSKEQAMSNHLKIFWSLVPLVFLVAMLTIVIRVYGPDALAGGSQIVLILTTSVISIIAITAFKVKWKAIHDEINKNIGSVGTAIVILLLIGMLSGTWTVSGVVPTLIYYGIQTISPQVFLITTCVLCGLVSLVTGSSWTTVATIGVALMGIGKALGFSDGWIAGAIISGAYFGDKMSPLSDTTVLASSMVGTPLFTHIRYMTITVIPSMVLALVIYLVAGFVVGSSETVNVTAYTTALASKYDLSPWLLLVPLVTGVMIYKRLPAIVVLFASSMMAIVFGVITQPHVLAEVAGETAETPVALFKGAMLSCYGSTTVNTGMKAVDTLLTTRGMSGMLNTIWLILCAMCFGGAMKGSGMLANIVSMIVRFTKTRGGLVSSTVFTGLFLNTTIADQYMAIMLSSSMFKDIYEEEGYEPKLLSRSIEDSCTVTSVLVPWNTCGMTQSTVLNVPAFAFVPYCFFNIISPFMTILVAIIGYKIVRMKKRNVEEME